MPWRSAWLGGDPARPRPPATVAFCRLRAPPAADEESAAANPRERRRGRRPRAEEGGEAPAAVDLKARRRPAAPARGGGRRREAARVGRRRGEVGGRGGGGAGRGRGRRNAKCPERRRSKQACDNGRQSREAKGLRKDNGMMHMWWSGVHLHTLYLKVETCNKKKVETL